MVERETARVENTEIGGNVLTRTFGAHVAVNMEARKVAEEALGRAWIRLTWTQASEQKVLDEGTVVVVLDEVRVVVGRKAANHLLEAGTRS